MPTFDDFFDSPSNSAVAIDLARRGLSVFPITRKGDGSWTPIQEWQTRATANVADVERMWSQYPDARVGLPCGAVNGISVLDVDTKDDKNGLDSLRRMGFDPGAMTPTMTETPSGGRHLFFRFDPRLKNWVGKLGEGLDVRTGGGYVIAPGSARDDALYRVIGSPIGSVDLPPFPETLIPAEKPHREAPVDLVEATPEQREWARGVLARQLAAFQLLTSSGSGRNSEVNAIAMWAGGAAAHGMLDYPEVKAAILDAAKENGHAVKPADVRATVKTIESGWSAGLSKPISEFPRATTDEELEDWFEEGGDEPTTAVATYDAMFDDAPAPAKVDLSDLQPGDWKRLLQRNPETNAILSTLPNAELIVANDDRLRGSIAFNELDQAVVFRSEPQPLRKKERDGKPIRNLGGPIWMLNNREERIGGRRWSDAHSGQLRSVIESPLTQGGYAVKLSDRDLTTAILNVANARSFHPVLDYLNGLEWDGISRLDRLFTDYFGAPDSDYHRDAARLWCIGAAVRSYEPGHKFDFVPILEGGQGLGKSTAIAILGGAFVRELTCDFHDPKSVTENLQGGWIYELGELQGFSKADITTLKAVVSRTSDRSRLAYARMVQDFPRRCVFIGSTNEKEYLRDLTGGRRFWPIECGSIDMKGLAAVRDQIWAEAVVAYRAMRAKQQHGDLPLFLSNPKAAAEAHSLQESRRSETPEEVLAAEIVEALNKPLSVSMEGVEEIRHEVTIKELWCDMLGRDRRDLTSQITTRLIGRSLRMAGWEPAGVAWDGGKASRYFARSAKKPRGNPAA